MYSASIHPSQQNVFRTSALDSGNERKIMDQLRMLSSGRPSIIIAHRLSTVRDADEIIVLGGATTNKTNDAGCVVERGTHEELLKLRGLYHQLWRQQTSENQNKRHTKIG